MSELPHPALREAAAVASRENNLVFLSPPSPAWAVPVLQGVFQRLQAGRTGPVLALCPSHAIDEWARVAELQARGTPLRVAGAHTPARLSRFIVSDTVDLVFATAETVHELVRRASLKLESLSAVLLIWPELWADEDVLAGLLQDLPKDTQRILLTTDAAATAALAERYCWRAPVLDLIGPVAPGTPPTVKSTPVSWRGRIDILGDLVEQLDPETLAVWTADASDDDAIARALAARGTQVEITNGIPGRASLIVLYDLPGPVRLEELTARGSVLLLVPPGTEAYAARIAPSRRPVHASGGLDLARNEVDLARRSIADAVGRGLPAAAYLALAPLLERYEATAVAAALYQLWDESRSRVAPSSAPPAPERAAPGATKLWIGVGKKDDATPNDLVGSLVKEMGVPRAGVGRVEMRETFSLVELTGVSDPEALAERMTGKTIKKRRLVVKVDRGRPPKRG